MDSSERLYELAIARIATAIAERRSEPDYYAMEEGAFVVDHDEALARTAAEAIGLRGVLEALSIARDALTTIEDGGAREA